MRAMLVLSLPLVLGACVSSSEYEGLAAERDVLAGRVAELQTEVATLEADKRRLQHDADGALAAATAAARKAALVTEARASLGLTAGQTLKATLRTGLGDVHCELWPDVAPKTVTNFVGLAEGTKTWTDPRTHEERNDPLYDGTVFHRIMPDFMIQGGDPLGNGTGGPGYRFEDEVTPEVTFSEPGLLAMANSGPGTNGSQFFITDSTPTYLNGRHTIFGKCDLDVVRQLMAVPLRDSGRGERSTPVEPVPLQTVIIERG